MSTMRVNTLVAQSGSAISLNSSLIINGDLTVIGDNFTATVTDLTVTDKNITVNNGGNDATSEGAGLTVFRTGTFGSLIYANALASKWACGALGSESEIVTVGTVQTLTAAKTFSSLITANGGINVIGSNLAVGSTSPVSLIHVRGSGTSAGTASPGILLENASSGSFGMYVTGTAGSSSANMGYAGVPGAGFGTFADAFKLVLEGSNAGRVTLGPETGAFPGNRIRGVSNGTADSAGFVGEILDSGLINLGVQPTTSYINIASISLTAGRWAVYGIWYMNAGGGNSTDVTYGLTLTSNGDPVYFGYTPNGNNLAVRDMVPLEIFNFSATTTLYMTARRGGGTGNFMNGRIIAIRTR